MKKQILFIYAAIFCGFTLNAAGTDTLKLTWPDDFDNPSQYDGKLIELNQTLYVTDIYNWVKYGSITLSSKRLQSPTEAALPMSKEYESIIQINSKDKLVLEDGSNTKYPDPLPWTTEEYGYIRTGAYTTHITGTFNTTMYGYTITPTETPIFENRERPTAPDNLGDYNLKVCGFNMQYYLASNYGTGFGPANEEQGDMQHKKLVKALLAIDADIYGLLEVQKGQNAIKKLTDALNAANPNAKYSFAEDPTVEYGTYTKSCYIYRSDKVTPIKHMKENNAEIQDRKRGLGFTLNANGEKFVFLINHFKAKSGNGKGENADQGDGQGIFNATRKKEAYTTTKFAKDCQYFYEDDDVLIMGDLNAHTMEDPVRIITDAGYTNLIKKYEGSDGYTYSFRGETGCLDHALANASMESQVTGCDVFHINTDESVVFGYGGTHAEDNMYRSSDHDPVVVGIKLGTYTALDKTEVENGIDIAYNNNQIEISNAENCSMSIWTIAGQCVYNTLIDSHIYSLNTNSIGLNKGVYLINFKNKQTSATHVEKLIVK